MSTDSKKLTFSVKRTALHLFEEQKTQLLHRLNKGNLNMRTSGTPYPKFSLSKLLTLLILNCQIEDTESGFTVTSKFDVTVKK